MPCMLFTFHAYGSWLPDRPQGYVHWRDGSRPQNKKLARAYRNAMTADEVRFDANVQRALIASLLEAAAYRRLNAHCAATETSHVHALVSWRDDRTIDAVSRVLKTSLSRGLNERCARRKWFSKGASKQPVRDQEHFDYLVRKYLPDHRGWKWDPSRGEYS